MLLVAFVQWWYGPGWRDTATRLTTRISDTYLTFSVPALLRTMFSPWRRIITYPGVSMQDRMRATLDNVISRVVGLMVRSMALIAAGALIAGYAIVGGLVLVLWPILPLLGPALIVGGFL
jgi:hypothetical protein